MREQSFLRETWYVAALSTEVPEDAPFARTILNEPVVMFRDTDGVVQAIADICPHRFVPLSMGSVRDGRVVCGYHGLEFDGTGHCRFNPHGNGRIPSGPPLRSYPVREVAGLIWIWTGSGDPEAGTLPAVVNELAAAPQTTVIRGYLHTRAHYQLMIDNLIDLSHSDYLHPGLLSTGGAVSRATPKVDMVDDRVKCSWEWSDDQAMGLFAPLLPDNGAHSRGRLSVEWEAPSRMTITTGAAPCGANTPEMYVLALHTVTPKDDKTTHYFHCGTRNYLTDDEEVTRLSLAGVTYAFAEQDTPMIEAAQRNMGSADFWELKPWILAGDGGAVWARRILDRKIQEERAPAKETAPA